MAVDKADKVTGQLEMGQEDKTWVHKAMETHIKTLLRARDRFQPGSHTYVAFTEDIDRFRAIQSKFA